MKKLILLLIPFLIAAAPIRQNQFVEFTTIRPEEVNQDFDDLFGYNLRGVDVLGNKDFGTFTCVSNVCTLDSGTTLNNPIFSGKTSDPCGSSAKGTQFYNSTSGYFCFCNNSGDDIKMSDNLTACF